MSAKFGICKRFYDTGMWSAKRLWDAVGRGWITEAEYHLIVDGEPEEPEAQPDEPDADLSEGGDAPAEPEGEDDPEEGGEDE